MPGPRILRFRDTGIDLLLDEPSPLGPVEAGEFHLPRQVQADAAGPAAGVPPAPRVAPRSGGNCARITEFEDLRAATGAPTTVAEMLQASEAAARRLMTEFPDQGDGYEWMLVLAAKAGKGKGAALAGELADSSAPDEVRQEARRMLTRVGLVGRKLAEIAPALMAAWPAGSRSLTIIYAWSMRNPASLARARLLGWRRVNAARWIGLNLDTAADHAFAKRLAALGRFPGLQVYDDRGSGSDLAEKLGLSAGTVLLIDTDGMIADVHTGDDLTDMLEFFQL
jgi:hypothetical protein